MTNDPTAAPGGDLILGRQPLTPVEVENRIQDLSDRLENSAEVIKQRHRAAREAERLLRREYAEQYLTHRQSGMSIRDAEMQTRLDTEPARQERDLAEVAHTYARDLARQLEQQLRALQTQSASLRVAYPMAGRGMP